MIIFLTVLTFEVRQIWTDGLQYFAKGWNINDCLFIILFGIIFWEDASRYEFEGQEHTHDDENTREYTRILYSLLIISSFVKLLDSLRIFNNISFIVKMLHRVTVELIPFLGLYIGFIFLFALVVSSLEIELDQVENMPYKGLPEWFGMAAFIFRTSLGDFDVDPFANLSNATRLFIWLFWFFVVFANTIIFLNFLIAVINDVYE